MAVIEAIATTYLEADAASVEFSGIPATYEHLQLRWSARSDRGNTYDHSYFRFNGDTAVNYSHHYLSGYASTADAGGVATQNTTYAYRLSGKSSAAESYGMTVLDIIDYTNTSKNTTISGIGGVNGTFDEAIYYSGLWLSTAAVHTIWLKPYQGSNFLRGSEFTLYGLNSA